MKLNVATFELKVSLAVYWQIKAINIEDIDDPQRFDKMIKAIRNATSMPGFSTILWSVRIR